MVAVTDNHGRFPAVRRLVMISALLAVALAAVTSSCGGSSAEDVSISDWVTFEGNGVALRLPHTFVGGDPRDPLVLEALAGRVAGSAQSVQKDDWLSAIDQMKEDAGKGIYSDDCLLIFGEPNSEGRMPVVHASVMAMRPGESMEAYVDRRLRFPGSEVTIESMTEDRAFCAARVRPPGSEDPDERWLQYVVFLELPPSSGRAIFYALDNESNTALDQIFRASAETTLLGDYGYKPSAADADALAIARR